MRSSRLPKNLQAVPWAIFILLIAALPGCESKEVGLADGVPIAVTARVDKPQSTVGDTVTYTVTITHNADTKISAPDISAPGPAERDGLKNPVPESNAFEGFEFIEKGESKPRRAKGGATQEFWYRLRADLVGDYTFPAFQISFTTPDAGGKTTPGQTATPKVDVEILSVLHLRGEPTDIHGIKPLARVGKDWYPYVIVILAILALAGLVNWARKKWSGKTRRADGQTETNVIPSPHELALKNLDRLLAQGLVQNRQFREYYFALSEIFRRYLGTRYAFPAIDWTTEEISAWLLGQRSLHADIQREAGCILVNTDRVKFAKGDTDPEACMEDMRLIKNFISVTKEKKAADKIPAPAPIPAHKASVPS